MGSSSKSKNFRKSMEFKEKQIVQKPKTKQKTRASSKSNSKAKSKMSKKPFIVGVGAVMAVAGISSLYSHLDNSQEKMNYNDWLETAGLEDTVKNTGIKPETVEKLIKLKEEVAEENVDNISNQRLMELVNEAYRAEIEAIHSKIKLFVGDNKTIEVYSYEEGKKTIDVDGRTIYANEQIPNQLIEAIDAAASVDKKLDYENINRDEEIKIIRKSLDEVMDIIPDRCYVNQEGKLVCDEAPTIKDGIIDEKAQEFMEEKYTTYVYDMYGELLPVILEGSYNEEYAEYDNPYISIEEYLQDKVEKGEKSNEEEIEIE